MSKKTFSYFFIFLFLFSSCGENSGKATDTPTSGETTVVADESLSLLTDAEVQVFEGIYTKAKINVSYKAEALVFNDLLENKTNVIIATRDLTPEEHAVFEKAKLVPRVTKIASDAITFVSNKANPQTSLSIEQIKGLVQGKITTWKQIDPASELGDIKLVFDNKNSSTVRYIKEKLIDDATLQITGFAVDSTPKMISYITEHPDAIGIMGVSWVSDHNDTISGNFLKNINVLAVKDSSGKEEYQPYQAYVAQKLYPFYRDVYVICTEPRAGLGSGFSNFVAGDKGQRIILKSGLVPSTMPVRIVGFREN